MIKQNELRVGNYHKTEPTNIPRLGITGSDYASITAYGIYLLESKDVSVEPILLTEDWLIKFKFKKELNPSWGKEPIYINGCVAVIYIDNNFYYAESVRTDTTDEFEPVNKENPLLYVHKLQNLYYELENKEL